VTTFTVVARLIGSLTCRTGSLYKPICQKSIRLHVKKLFNLPFYDQTGIHERLPELPTKLAIGGTMGGAIMIEFDSKTGKIALMLTAYPFNPLGLCNARVPGTDHDGSAMSIIGTKIAAVVAPQFLESYPNIRLYVLHQMTQVDRPIGVGQGRCHQNSAFGHYDLQVSGEKLQATILTQRLITIQNPLQVFCFDAQTSIFCQAGESTILSFCGSLLKWIK
jgi:hypothetical protein